jgi:hypothetical protein
VAHESPDECQRIGPKREILPLVPGSSGSYAGLVMGERASVRDVVAAARESGGGQLLSIAFTKAEGGVPV